MPLSTSKLEEMLNSKGLKSKNFYSIHGMCVYVEVLCLATSETFLLYIPSKYEIKCSDRSNVFQMDYMDIGEDGHIPGDYGGQPSDIALEKTYDEIDIEDGPETGDIVGHLEEHYNRPLALKNVSCEDIMELRDVFRQLRRLKFCVQSLKYKLCISFKNFMCCIRRDDTFEGYIVKNGSIDGNRRLTVTIDLETAYSKFDTVSSDINCVKEGVYAVLDKNQIKHSKSLGRMMEQRALLADTSIDILKKKASYMSYIQRLKLLASQVLDSEKLIYEKLSNLKPSSSSADIKGFHSDVERTHHIVQHEKELDRLSGVKKELLANLLEVSSKYENVVLKVDKILFDNSVMLDAILKNLAELETM
jgi:hypothetical protein